MFRRDSPSTSAAPIAEFVRRLRPGPRAGLLALRAIALSLGPDVIERVDEGRVVFWRGERKFVFAEPVRNRLVAAFPPDVPVADPMGRLLKRGEERYFRLDSAEDMDAHAQEFVRGAYAVVRA